MNEQLISIPHAFHECHCDGRVEDFLVRGVTYRVFLPNCDRRLCRQPDQGSASALQEQIAVAQAELAKLNGHVATNRLAE